jgi:RNA polymerase sporulation-specific sigma factor
MKMEELVENAKNHDKNAMEEIINKLTPYVIKMSYSTFIRGYEIEDLKQIGYISIIKAVNKYDFNKNDNFLSYAIMSIRNNYFYEIRKKVKENTDTSIDQTFENGIEFSEIIPDSFNMAEEFLHKADLDRLSRALELLQLKERDLIIFIYKNGCSGIKKYAELNGINYQTCAKRKVAVIKKLRELIETL